MKVVHQGRGGFIEVEGFKFDIEMMATGPAFAIYFPRREFDIKLNRIRKKLDQLVTENPKKWVIQEYDSEHGLYDGMTVYERLFVAEVIEDFDDSVAKQQVDRARQILLDLDLNDEDINVIISKKVSRQDGSEGIDKPNGMND